jgi:UDP-4-amino-4,6-dideoxy-N-acetyl-beta-L-altrosamine N-acetyltransferase
MVLSWRNHPDVRRQMFTSHEIVPAEHNAWWAAALSDSRRRYFICEDASDGPVGVVGFTELDPVNRTASWLMYSGRLDRRGLGRRMELSALDYAFGPLALEKLWGEGLTSNTAVLSLHRRFGFRVEGLFRDHVVSGGERRDVWRIGMLRDEWTRNRPLVAELLRQRLSVDETLSGESAEPLLARACEAATRLMAQLIGRRAAAVRRIELRPTVDEPSRGAMTVRLTWTSTIGGRDVVAAVEVLDGAGAITVEGEIEARVAAIAREQEDQGAGRAARGATSVA